MDFQSPIELEQALIGALFLEPSLIRDYSGYLKPEMFRDPRHRNLIKIALRLNELNQNFDPLTIGNRYAKHMNSIGGVLYITELAGSAVSAAKFEYHLQQLLVNHARRNAIALIDEYRELFSDPARGEFEELLDEFERKSLSIRPKNLRSDRENGIGDVISWYEELIEKKNDPSKAFGLMTEWGDFDRLTLGFQRKDLYVVGARTSMGKSAFANEVGLRVSRRGDKVSFFSLEMSKGQLYNRMATNLTNVPMQAIRIGNVTDYQLELISGAMDKIRRVHVDDTRGVTVEYITSEMRRMKRQEGLDLVIIDYLQEIVEPAEKNDNSGTPLKRVCQKLRAAADECDCHILALSQLTQDVDKRQNKRPLVSDLAGSAGIAAVADGIVLLYRDEYYNPDTDDRGILEVNIAKQRNGPTGMIKLKYDKNYQRISSMGGKTNAQNTQVEAAI